MLTGKLIKIILNIAVLVVAVVVIILPFNIGEGIIA